MVSVKILQKLKQFFNYSFTHQIFYQFQAIAFFICALVCASQASVLPLGATIVGPPAPGVLITGPATRADVLGPDGSAISVAAQAGVVVAPPIAGGVVNAAVAPGVVAAAAVPVAVGHAW